jgi:phosphatidylglycerol lysyltransferase
VTGTDAGRAVTARVLPEARRASRALGQAVRRRPVTAVVLLLVLAASVTAGTMRFAHGRPVPDALVPFRVFAVTTGVLALVLTLAGVVVLVGAAERLMGSRRTAAAFLATSVAGAAAAAVVGVIDPDGRHGAALLSGAEGLDPWTAILGTVTTASAFAGPLWRRRIRVNALAVVLALFLYAGHTTDLSAVVATAAGWGLGEVFRRTPKRTGWTRSSHRETRVLLGTVVLVSAVGPVIALVSRARVGLLAPLAAVVGLGPADQPSVCRADGVAGECLHRLLTYRATDPWSLLLAVAPLLVLVVGAVGLFRGSRFAVWLVVVVDTVTGIAAAVTYTHVSGRVAQSRGSEDHVVVVLSIAASIAVPLLTAVVLVTLRRSFTVVVARERVVVFTVTVLAAAAVLATVVFVAADASPVRVHDPFGLVVAVLGPLSPVVHRLPIRDPGLRTVLSLVGPLLWAVVAVAAVRPAGAAPGAADADVTTADRERARALLVAGGGDTFGWMATWPGNAHWFSADGRAGVAYRRAGTVAVALGPFGWPDARHSALTEFARHCDDNGWTAVFHGIDTTSAAALTALGWRTLPVAEDAAFDPRQWTTSGSRKQDVRTAVNKARRSGCTATWSSWQDLPAATTRQIEAISEEWVADRELPEMGFTLGSIDEMRDPAVRTLVAQDAEGAVLGVTSWLPSHREGRVVGWTLDVMRRRADAPNGVMEFLVASAAEVMRDQGVERLGLSAAPLARTPGTTAPSRASTDAATPARAEPAGAKPAAATVSPTPGTAPAGNTSAGDGVETLLELVGGVLEPVYGFRSLLRFKRKFGPDLEPLVLAYPDPVALPAIGVAVVRAYLPDLSLRQALALVRGRG